MSVVKINAITVEPDGPTSSSPGSRPAPARSAGWTGFEAFELLRPNDDRNQFLVYTRWRSEEDFQAWVSGPAFQHGHKAHNTPGSGEHRTPSCGASTSPSTSVAPRTA